MCSMNIAISRDDIKQVYDMEWKKKLESKTYESFKTLPISYMDKFLKQLKEKFEFEFISNSIYQVGFKILNLIKSGDYGNSSATRLIQHFIDKNIELDGFVLNDNILGLKDKHYTIQEAINDMPFEHYVTFQTIFEFLEKRIMEDEEFKLKIHNYLNNVVYNLDYQPYVLDEGKLVRLDEVEEIKTLLKMTMKISCGKANPILFSENLLKYKWFQGK